MGVKQCLEHWNVSVDEGKNTTSIQVLLVTGSEYTVEHKTFENKFAGYTVMPNCRVWLSLHLLFSAYRVSSIRHIFAYHLYIQVHAFIKCTVHAFN